eukprot:scaffold14520_cov109-Isochrysis_galbana.AAC.7
MVCWSGRTSAGTCWQTTAGSGTSARFFPASRRGWRARTCRPAAVGECWLPAVTRTRRLISTRTAASSAPSASWSGHASGWRKRFSWRRFCFFWNTTRRPTACRAAGRVCTSRRQSGDTFAPWQAFKKQTLIL